MKFLKNLFVCSILFLAVMPAFAGGQQEDEKVLKFAGSGGYPPFNFFNEDNEVTGFDVDVAEEIASRLGYEMEYVTTAWDGIIEGLRAGRYNGILGSMGITEERLKVVDFSDPYYYSGAQVITRADSGISTPADLTSSSAVGFTTGSTYQQDAQELGVDMKFYDDDNQTLMELVNGRLDGVITDRVVAVNAMSKIKGGEDLILAGELLRTEECAVAIRKDDPLKDDVNKALAEMRADGTLSAISEKWFGLDITNP